MLYSLFDLFIPMIQLLMNHISLSSSKGRGPLTAIFFYFIKKKVFIAKGQTMV